MNGFHATLSKAPTEHRLRIVSQACLSRRFPDFGCKECVEACPVEALTLWEEGPALAAACMGCGQCAARCPTTAIRVEGFQLPEGFPEQAREIYVDCWRVPLSDALPATWRVPCLGGVSDGALYALVERVGERAIFFLERGACAECPVGSGMAAWRARLEDVRRNLAAVGVADALLPAIKVLPARGPLAPMIPDSEEALPMSRRAFFRRLVEEAACSLEGKERKEGHSPSPREKLVPEGRLQAIVALCRIAERHGMAAPHEALPRLMLSHCCGHGVCERVCPTGALVRRQDGNEVVVEFHAARCLACGLCLKHCPQQAVRLATSGGALVMELARQPVRRCALCDEIFYDESEECPACRTERQLKEGVAAWFEPFHRTCSQEEVKGWIS